MIDRDWDTTALSIMRQCELLGLSRSSLYYRPQPIADADLRLMRRLDELHLTHPFLGARRLARLLQRENVAVGRRHVGTLMALMGIEAIYRKKRTSLPAQGHRIYPYLLRDVVIERPNQVWATDVTYLPMAQGFAYLVAILDLYSRKVLAFRVSTTLAPDFCIEALGEALRRHGAPEIFNTDQGSQFTDDDFTAVLAARGVRLSMDGKGRWIDNVFVERLWRSVKYESIYLHAYETPREVRVALARYFEFYNARRPHQSLGYRTPNEIYFGTHKRKRAAA
jgi:putative transposase